MKNSNINNIRQQKILEELNLNHYVSVTDLCKKLKVSAVTIRKDLNHLEKIGKLFRTHGGATRESFIIEERHINKKETINVEQKEKIAQKAASLIKDNDFIIIASGTTTQSLAQEVLNINYEKLTILSSSLKTSIILYNNPDFDVIQLGGDIRKKSGSVMGPFSELMLMNYSCNKLFLGGDGIDFDFGLSTSSTMEAKQNQIMIEHSEKVIVLIDSSKIGKRGFGKITDLDKINILITDSGVNPKDVKRFNDLGIEVLIAE